MSMVFVGGNFQGSTLEWNRSEKSFLVNHSTVFLIARININKYLEIKLQQSTEQQRETIEQWTADKKIDSATAT